MKNETKTLTPAMKEAIEILHRDGAIIAGRSEYGGRVERISASTIRALASRGVVTLAISPDGGMMGRPVAEVSK